MTLINHHQRSATAETAREINRSIMLNTIRTSQPISRADLARVTGLQRSTVSSIAEQLIHEGWVAEGAIGQLPRGRKPRLLNLNTERARIIGVNIMPATSTVALADLNLNFCAQQSFPTEKEPRRFIADLIERAGGLMKSHPGSTWEGMGVSLPGRVDRSTERLVFAPNLGWRDVDLKTPLEKATGLSVLIDNAANACALSEVWSGPFAGQRDLIAVTVSEGIGIGIIANGRLVHGPTGAAGEFGHVCLNPQGPPCPCGSRGCWEVYASNAAAVRNYNRGLVGRSRARERLQASASVRDFSDLLQLATRGDVMATEVLDRMGEFLGWGLAMLVNGLAPSVIRVVGEVTRVWERIVPNISRVVEATARMHSGTRILPTDPRSEPRLRGTVALVLQKHFQPGLFG